METTSKNNVTTSPHPWGKLGNGGFFWMFFFVYSVSNGILTVGIDWNSLQNSIQNGTYQLEYFTWILVGMLCIFGVLFRSKYILVLSIIPILLYYQINHIFEVRREFFLGIENLSNTTLSGVIDGKSGVKNGTIKITISTEEYGKGQITIPIQRGLTEGDIVSLQLTEPKIGEGFHLARGIYWTAKANEISVIGTHGSIFNKIKNRSIEVIQTIFPQPERGLITGILLGDASLMREELQNTFKVIGLSHITVVSGSNISFVLTSTLLLLFWVSKKPRIIIAITGVLSYILLVGTDPPVLRAGIMGVIAGLCLLFPGKIDSLRVLSLTGIILLLFSPLSLLYDPGFQLSFLATAGILMVGTIFPNTSGLRQSVLISIFAALWTIPVTVGQFGTFHTWSVVANILVGPFVGIAMTLTLLSCVLTSIWSFGSFWIGYIAYSILLGIVWIAENFAVLPFAIEITENIQGIIGYSVFGIISGLTYRFQYLRKISKTNSFVSQKL